MKKPRFPRPKVYTERLDVRISPELMRALKMVSAKKGITASEMVRRLVVNYLEGLGETVG